MQNCHFISFKNCHFIRIWYWNCHFIKRDGVIGWLGQWLGGCSQIDKKSGNPNIHPEIQWFILIVFIKTVTCAMVKTCFIVTGDGQKSIRGSCVQGKDDGMIMPHIQVPCFDHRPSSASLGPPCEAPVACVRLRSCSRRAPSQQGDGWSNDLTKWPTEFLSRLGIVSTDSNGPEGYLWEFLTLYSHTNH
jgi:hypothetical protein